VSDLNRCRWVALPMGVLLALVTACSSGTSTTHTTSSSAQQTVSTVSTPSPTAATTAGTTGSDLPSYSQIVATYPHTADLCDTEANIKPDGSYDVTGGSLQMINNEIQVPCYGIKITVLNPMSIHSKTYEAGAKFTVDAHKRLTPVSSWD
jgi:hypothetical protein